MRTRPPFAVSWSLIRDRRLPLLHGAGSGRQLAVGHERLVEGSTREFGGNLLEMSGEI